MWLGDITYGSDQDSPSDPNAPPASTPQSDSYVRLATDLIETIHPYKQGLPVNVAISPQTQSFLIMGGVLIAGVVILSMIRR